MRMCGKGCYGADDEITHVRLPSSRVTRHAIVKGNGVFAVYLACPAIRLVTRCLRLRSSCWMIARDEGGGVVRSAQRKRGVWLWLGRLAGGRAGFGWACGVSRGSWMRFSQLCAH